MPEFTDARPISLNTWLKVTSKTKTVKNLIDHLLKLPPETPVFAAQYDAFRGEYTYYPVDHFPGRDECVKVGEDSEHYTQRDIFRL